MKSFQEFIEEKMAERGSSMLIQQPKTKTKKPKYSGEKKQK